MSSPLNHPFRPAISLKAQPQQNHTPDAAASSQSPLEGALPNGGQPEGADKRSKLNTKLKIGLGVFFVIYILFSLFDPFGGILESISASLGGRQHARIDDDYELAQFADEEGLESAERSGKEDIRSVSEANEKAGFFGRIFCRGMGRSQFCD